MPIEHTITIINNSGKVISTGKHLVNIFKDAKAAYQEKKAALKSERLGVRRAQTFDVARGESVYDEYEIYDRREPRYLEDRRRSHDELDGRSYASSHSHRSRRSHRSRTGGGGGHRGSRPALTESNLHTLSEVSATTPSIVPQAYRSPYAETAPRDMALSRPTLNHAATYHTGPPTPTTFLPTQESTPVSTPRQSMAVGRPRSDPSLRQRAKEIDMNLAYGTIPPDLESRTDLDPAHKESEARSLMQRVEGLLVEAQCVHHTASSIIAHLQGNPEAAAAVALTLAELSALLAKMSPAFLGIVKGGSPAVFALLASPQFLIGTGIAVGVTVVMFGGWKIVKRLRAAQAIKAAGAEAQAFEMTPQPPPMGAGPPGHSAGGQGFVRGASLAGAGAEFDDALVLEEELSTIESWRRGIVPFGEEGEGESVDAELISPEAMRSRLGEREGRRTAADAATVRTGRTGKTHRSHRSSGRSHHGHGHHRSHRGGHDDGDDDEYEVPERRSSKGFAGRDREARERGGTSEVSSSSRRSNKGKSRVSVRAIEDGSRQRGDDDDVSRALSVALRPKEKKNNMLKQLFKKKKDKDDREQRPEVSVLV